MQGRARVVADRAEGHLRPVLGVGVCAGVGELGQLFQESPMGKGAPLPAGLGPGSGGWRAVQTTSLHCAVNCSHSLGKRSQRKK